MADYELQRKPWKVWMSSAPDPTAVLVSAYDLLNGTSLGHDIIIYNGNLYSNGIFSGSSFDDFYRYELDISPAIFDKRSKPKTVDFESEHLSDLCNDTDLTKATVYYYDKDAALYPENIKAFFYVNKDWKTYFRSSSQMGDYSIGVGYQTADFLSCTGVESDTELSSVTSDIILYSKDSVFSSTMVFEDGKNAYTKAVLNSNNEKVIKLIVGAVLFNSDINLPDWSNTYYSFVFKELLKNEEILKHIYFWVKGPFCADYIDPDDFNQDLNQDAEVVHRNLLLANSYNSVRNNFNRYNEMYSSTSEEYTTITDYMERMSRPYIPTNSPLKDFLSKGLLTQIGGSGDETDGTKINDNAEALIANSYEDDHIIGSILSVPGNSDSKDWQSFVPFNFYDPESREQEDYYVKLKRIPTLIGRDGNLTTDGRLISPTIDELWYIIKKLISGEQAADDTRLTRLASPKNSNAIDTTLTEAVKAQYYYDGKTIDPIDFSYTYNTNENDTAYGSITGIDVKEYVVQPETVNHNVYDLLKVVSERLNLFYKENLGFDSLTLDELFTTSNTGTITYEGNSRDITKTGEDLVIGTTRMTALSSNDNEYGARSSAPLSLRELEAAILGNKYNIENNFMFASKTYAVTGGFGKQVRDSDNNIISGGSLYQMHRDYNGKVEDPNTYFKLGGKATEANPGYDIAAGDLNGEEERITSPADIPVYLLDEHNHRTTTVKAGVLPLLVENYGKSVLLEEQQGAYTGADVYMAADGTWRYKAEHVRLQILRERF